MNRKLIPYGTKLPVAFSSKELDDIRSCIMIGEEFGRHAVVDGKRFRLNLSLDDIEDLQATSLPRQTIRATLNFATAWTKSL